MQRVVFRYAALTLSLVLLSCTSVGGLKIMDPSDAKKAAFAKPKQTFSPSESPLIRIHGYGGTRVTVQLKEATRGPIGTITKDIPKATVQNTPRGVSFRSEGPWIVPTEREGISWATTELIIPIKPLPLGRYEVSVSSSDGRHETQTFEVKVKP